MKKLIIALVASASVTAMSDISLNIYTGYGFTPDAGYAGPALVEAFYAGADGVANDPTAGGGGAFGDDVLIDSFVFGYTAGTGIDYSFNDYAPDLYWDGTIVDSIDSGLYDDAGGTPVFARIYLDSNASVGSSYYTGIVRTADNVNLLGTPPPTPFSYNFGGDDGVVQSTMATVIPEPATLGLLGIAGAGLYMSRRKMHA
jgi:hypothetical protein